MHAQIGSPLCRPCGEHHRGSECPINSEGQALAPCGCTWEQTWADGHWFNGCCSVAGAGASGGGTPQDQADWDE